jgi:hypothetical protein
VADAQRPAILVDVVVHGHADHLAGARIALHPRNPLALPLRL